MENKENFNYTYSAKEQEEIKAIRKKYVAPEQAEDKISSSIANYPENSGYYLGTDYEGYLCLCVEVIRDIDPPNVVVDGDYTISSGCNIDHEHLFFSERISKE